MAKTGKPQKVRYYDIIKYPLSTEKSVRLMEAENKLLFVVDHSATKKDVKDAVKSLFGVTPESVNILIDAKNVKKAYVKLPFDTPAIDIATDLGLI